MTTINIASRAAAATVACMAAAVASAQANKVPFATRLDQARTSLQVDGQGLHGSGANVIARAVEQARYVLIGEDHFSREIPLFSTGICRIMAPSLRAFAVEAGPEVAIVVNENLRRPDRVTRIASFTNTHPDAMAFQNGQDESDMAAQCARLAGPGFQIWGLDQEFFGSAGYLIEKMLAAKPGPNARVAIERLAVLDRSMSATAMTTGSPGDLFIYKVTDQQMKDASSPIASDGGSRTNGLFDALKETRAIYLGQNNNGFASNGQRARLMKRTLVRYLGVGPKAARVLFKFGDVHMAKGINGLDQRDLGNFVAERADGEGATSLHIAVYGAKGIHALYAGVGRQVRHEPFVMTDDADYSWLKDALAAQSKNSGGRDWMLIDLRALRTKPPVDMPAEWRKKAQEYDLLVVAPDLTPSRLLGAK